MSVVSRALDESPTVVLKSLGWRYGDRDIDPEPAQRSTTGTESTAASGAAAAIMTRRQSGFIDAEIRPFNGDYRGAIAEIDKFSERLRREAPVAEVRVVKYPLNVNPGTALSGNTLDNRAEQSNSAPFKVVIVFKPQA